MTLPLAFLNHPLFAGKIQHSFVSGTSCQRVRRGSPAVRWESSGDGGMGELGRWWDGWACLGQQSVRFQVSVPAASFRSLWHGQHRGRGNSSRMEFSPGRIPGAIVGKWKQAWVQVES